MRGEGLEHRVVQVGGHVGPGIGVEAAAPFLGAFPHQAGDPRSDDQGRAGEDEHGGEQTRSHRVEAEVARHEGDQAESDDDDPGGDPQGLGPGRLEVRSDVPDHGADREPDVEDGPGHDRREAETEGVLDEDDAGDDQRQSDAAADLGTFLLLERGHALRHDDHREQVERRPEPGEPQHDRGDAHHLGVDMHRPREAGAHTADDAVVGGPHRNLAHRGRRVGGGRVAHGLHGRMCAPATAQGRSRSRPRGLRVESGVDPDGRTGARPSRWSHERDDRPGSVPPGSNGGAPPGSPHRRSHRTAAPAASQL